jgi:hypothetical protein
MWTVGGRGGLGIGPSFPGYISEGLKDHYLMALKTRGDAWGRGKDRPDADQVGGGWNTRQGGRVDHMPQTKERSCSHAGAMIVQDLARPGQCGRLAQTTLPRSQCQKPKIKTRLARLHSTPSLTLVNPSACSQIFSATLLPILSSASSI